uniref:Uncharacterized protein n=1 Tax=Bos mutus grunniens TaxID=30521 RepID=A0A8B9YTX1_BOSMU
MIIFASFKNIFNRTSRLVAVGTAPPLTPLVTAATMPGGLLLGDEAPNFEANTPIGRIRFHDYLGDSISMLTMVKGPQKSYLFPSLMIRIGTLPSSWACWTQQRKTKGHACDCSCEWGQRDGPSNHP